MCHCGCLLCAAGSHCLTNCPGGVEEDTLPLQRLGTGIACHQLLPPAPAFLDQRNLALANSSSTAAWGGELALRLELRRVCSSCLKASCIYQLFLLLVFDYVASSMQWEGCAWRGAEASEGGG